MKKSPLLFILCVLFMVGCNNDLDLTAPTKDIPIVYGVFSKIDTDHYIRIEKAFIDDLIPAAELAVDSENFLYDDLTVQVIKDGTPIDLQRIDGNVEGFSRETGFFDNEPNVLYKLENTAFGAEQVITLSIDRGPGFEAVTSSMEIVDNILLTNPDPFLEDKINISAEPNSQTIITFKPGKNAKIFDIFITFHYTEQDAGGQVFEKEVVWSFTRNQDLDGDGTQRAENDGLNFYNLLQQTIPVEPGTSRRFNKFSIDVVGGGQAIRDYIALTQANTGITSSQAVPNFSNLSEGLGIFSSKFTYHLDSVDISQVGRLELETGELLRDLNFGN